MEIHYQKRMECKAILGLSVMIILFLLAIYRVTNDADAQAAREILRTCEFNNLVSSMCGNAQIQWDNSIQGAWSLAAVAWLLDYSHR